MKLIKMMIGLMLFHSNPISSATARPLLSARETPSAPPMPQQMQDELKLAQIRTEMKQWCQEQWFKDQFEEEWADLNNKIDEQKRDNDQRLPQTMYEFGTMVAEIRGIAEQKQLEKNRMDETAHQVQKMVAGIEKTNRRVRDIYDAQLNQLFLENPSLRDQFAEKYEKLMAEPITAKLLRKLNRLVEEVKQE